MNIKKIKNTYANILTSMRDCLSSCMQGRQNLGPKMFYQVNIDTLVPDDNFYRKLNQNLDFHFLYKATSKYYRMKGQESIDPVVFFKILQVGYLDNINSDNVFIKANASMDSLVEKEIIEDSSAYIDEQ